MLELSKYNDVMESAFAETAPHKICQYIFDLSNAFNSFYHDTRILGRRGQGAPGKLDRAHHTGKTRARGLHPGTRI